MTRRGPVTQLELFPTGALGIANPALFGACGSLAATVLAALLYVYRRRAHVLLWVAGWALFTVALALAAGNGPTGASAATLHGLFRFLRVTATLCLAASALALRRPPWFRWRHLLVALVPILAWAAASPRLPAPSMAVLPGYLLSSALLGAGGFTLLGLRRAAWRQGTGVLGGALVLTAVTQACIGVSVVRSATGVLPPALLLCNGLSFLLAALAMPLQVIDELSRELRAASRRLRETAAELRELAITDELTGCHNRRFFHEIIGREIQRHHRYETPLSLLFVDIDQFKEVNDTLGHEAGDRLLVQVARFLERNVRQADYVFRWGGDEFLVLLSCRVDEARERGKELRNAFQPGLATSGLPAAGRLSVGCAEATAHTDDIIARIRAADEDMYLHKKKTIGETNG